MKKIKFANLSQTTKKFMLDTARDLPFGRFLARVSPSTCREVLELDINAHISDDLQIFCEQISRLCRDESWAKNYLLRGQSSLRYHREKIRLSPDRSGSDKNVAEKMDLYIDEFVQDGDSQINVDYYHSWIVDVPNKSFNIELSADFAKQMAGLELFFARDWDRKSFAACLPFAIFVGTAIDSDWAKVFWSGDQCLFVEFPLAVPREPVGGRVLRFIKIYNESSGRKQCDAIDELRKLYAPWYKAVEAETEKEFRARGLGFVFDE